jgi:hypothetical protein
VSRASEGRPVAKALRGHRKAKSDQSAPKATVGLKACPEMQGSKARKASAVQGVWLESEASAERKAPMALPAETAPLARWDSEASAANKALTEATAQLDLAEKKATRAIKKLLDQSARAAKSDQPAPKANEASQDCPASEGKKGQLAHRGAYRSGAYVKLAQRMN